MLIWMGFVAECNPDGEADAIQGRVEEGAGFYGLNNKNLEASPGRSIYIFAVHSL